MSADARLDVNRALRRVDWRWLLPNPCPHATVCLGGDRLLIDGIGLISQTVARSAATAAQSCDLAVAVNPSPSTLRSAWRSLRPGGWCYTEWYSPLVGGAPGVRRRLHTAGFEMHGCYSPWPWPTLASPRVWLPLEQAGALRHFLRSRPPAGGPIREGARALLRATWRVGHGLRLARPVCTLARKPLVEGLPPAHTDTVDLLGGLRGGWSEWGLGPLPDRLSAILLTGGPRPANKIIALVFAEPDPQPKLAVKMPRVPEAVASLHAEAAALCALAKRAPTLGRGVPRLVFRDERGGLPVLGESAVVGVPLFAKLRPGTYREYALKATDWLTQLAWQPRRASRETWWDRLVEPVLTDFQALFGGLINPELLARTRAGIAQVSSLPLVFNQGDFWTGNVVVDARGELGVLDWESAEPRGLPVLDLLYFLADLTFLHDGAFASGRFGEAYRASLDPSTPTGALRSECLERYTRRLEIEPEELRALRWLVWLPHACFDFRQLAAAPRRPPPAAAERATRFVDLWLEEARDLSAR